MRLRVSSFGIFLSACWLFPPSNFVFAAERPNSEVETFERRALAEWILEGETLPAEPSTLAALLSDLPAAVRLAKNVTRLDYAITAVDTGEYELATPRGLIVRVRPVKKNLNPQDGLFEAVGEGIFHRPGGPLKGRYALRFKYDKPAPDGVTRGNFSVYIDVENPFLRFFGLFVRGLINAKLSDEMQRMLAEAKQVMAEAQRKLSRGQKF